MNYTPFSKLDPEEERRRVLAKIYSLLIRLAEEMEADSESKDEEKLEPLKSNIPSEV